ncbi:MAG: hypothetical protein JWO91_3791, partial [Acidobacteriaceae bacterium]|nr:hypothetical protein [Acidobacteriaceae bacterium]
MKIELVHILSLCLIPLFAAVLTNRGTAQESSLPSSPPAPKRPVTDT